MRNENKTIPDSLDDFSFLFEGGRAIYFYPHYSINHMYSVRDNEWPLDICVASNFKNHLVKWYYIAKSEKEFDKHLDRFIDNQFLLKKIEDFITKTRESITTKLQMDFETLTDKELIDLAREHYSHFERMLRSSGTLRYIDRAIIPRFKNIFSSHNNFDELVSLASTSERPSFSTKEEMDLLRLAVQLKKKRISISAKETYEKIKKIHDAYCWFVCGYFDEKAKTISDYQKVLKTMIREEPEAKLLALRKRTAQELAKREDVFKSYGKDVKLLAHIASQSAYLKDYCKFSINKMIYYAEPLFNEIACRTNQTPEFIKDLYPEETMALLYGKSVDESKVKERTNHNILIVKGGHFYEYTGKAAAQFEFRYLTTELSAQDELRGRAANRGYGRGKAKIILGGKDFHKLKKGDILVVTNTSPDFVPILGKSAAIVAEEGGITTHVSVISRELNIPCVVGIPHITQIIKDGDLVEVDADRGIVRIITRK